MSPSPYFDNEEPRRTYRPRDTQDYPRQQQKPPAAPQKGAAPTGWFSRFLKKKKDDR